MALYETLWSCFSPGGSSAERWMNWWSNWEIQRSTATIVIIIDRYFIIMELVWVSISHHLHVHVHVCIYRPINKPLLPKRIGVDVMESYWATGFVTVHVVFGKPMTHWHISLHDTLTHFLAWDIDTFPCMTHWHISLHETASWNGLLNIYVACHSALLGSVYVCKGDLVWLAIEASPVHHRIKAYRPRISVATCAVHRNYHSPLSLSNPWERG